MTEKEFALYDLSEEDIIAYGLSDVEIVRLLRNANNLLKDLDFNVDKDVDADTNPYPTFTAQ